MFTNLSIFNSTVWSLDPQVWKEKSLPCSAKLAKRRCNLGLMWLHALCWCAGRAWLLRDECSHAGWCKRAVCVLCFCCEELRIWLRIQVTLCKEGLSPGIWGQALVRQAAFLLPGLSLSVAQRCLGELGRLAREFASFHPSFPRHR